MRLRCRLLGHEWASYNVGTARNLHGNPEVWMNDRCLRCDEYRNPFIAAEQWRLLHHPYAVETGDWLKGRSARAARA